MNTFLGQGEARLTNYQDQPVAIPNTRDDILTPTSSPRAPDGVHRCDVQWWVIVDQSGSCDRCEGAPKRVARDIQLAVLALLVVEPLYRLVHA